MAKARTSTELTLELVLEGDTPLTKGEIEKLVACVLRHYKVDSGQVDVGVQFLDSDAITDLNSEYRSVETATDVLSFPIDGGDPLPDGIARQLGDIAICVEYVEDQLANGRQMSDDDDSIEAALRRCVVHGLLHLMGEEHEDEAGADAMLELENEMLETCAPQ